MLNFVFACSSVVTLAQPFPFNNPQLPAETRISDLVSRLTVEEKASLMLYNSPAIPRLGIEEYNWWNECLHGVARAGKATVFPQAIGLAATFDDDLAFRVATAISDEARAKHHEAIRMGNRGQYTGLTFWTPNINIFRDPRWGRGQETYGEDPLLTGKMGSAFVKGLQGNDPEHLKVAACAKHFVVHSGPEKVRHTFNAIPEERDFRETYLPAFETLVNAGVESVMCAYNRTYDEPCCGSPYLLNDILRKEWGFTGHVVSDCWALDDIWLRHKVVPTREEAAAMAAKAGVNMNCGYIYQYLPKALELGLITSATLDSALIPMLRTRFRLGLFDIEDKSQYASIPPEVVNSKEHRELAYEAAVKSIVLLKNEKNVLPLNPEKLTTLFVAGAIATDITCLLGNYSGISGNLVTILEGITSKVSPGTVVEHNQGYLFNNDSLFEGFWQASRAEAVIVCLGINSLFEGEEGESMYNPNGGDRLDISLPKNQIEYVKRMKAKMGERPLIAVITGGSAISLVDIEPYVDAILFAWYPGEQGGNAVADILFGNQNPSGRLPVTFYQSMKDLPAFDDYSMENRTYKYFQGEPEFPFGFGLSYTEFTYGDIDAKTDMENIRVSMNISNTGARDGAEVVQLYVRKLDPVHWRPVKQLAGFKRIFIKSRENEEITVNIPLNTLRYWDADADQYKTEPGEYEIMAGSSSEDIRVIKRIALD